METIFNLKEYIFSWRVLLILVAVVLLFANDIASYIKEKKAEMQLGDIKKNTEEMKQQLTIVLKEHAIATANWRTLDISSGVPKIADTAFLLFRSQGGVVTGYVQGEGVEERYPFDTSVNDNLPVPVKIKEEKIRYITTAPKDKAIPFQILVQGFRIKR